MTVAPAPLPPLRSARGAWLAVGLVIAALLHIPFVPNPFPWFASLLEARDIEIAEVDGEAIIPIDLDLTSDLDPTAPPAPSAAAPDVEPTRTAPLKPTPAIADAGVDASPEDEALDAGARDAAADAEVADAEVPDGSPAAVDGSAPAVAIDAGEKPDVAAADAGPSIPGVRDPFAAAGGPSVLAKTDNNVKILIASDRIRTHELGAQFGQILTLLPEWKSFFAGTQIDPIRDLDHMLISGPQLRDSRKVVAVMDYNVPEAKIRGAIDVIVDRSKPDGEWLADAPVPAAIGKADKGPRVFAMVPGKRLLVVMPPELKDQLEQLKAIKPFNKSSAVGILVYVVNPGHAIRGGPVKVPDSLKWARLSVTPTGDGGADLAIDSLDTSPDVAAKHADELTAALEQVRKPDLGMFNGLAKIELFDPVRFVAEGASVRARTHVTKAQIRTLLAFVQQRFGAKSAPAATSPSP